METTSFLVELLTYIGNASLWLLRLLAVIGLIVFGMIKCIQILKKDYFNGKKKYVIISIVSLVIGGLSWIFNMGWFRFFMTLLLVPVIHSVIFFYMNLSAAKYFDQSQKMKRLNLFFIVTFLISHILTPDFPIGNDGGMFSLFGLINNAMFNGLAIVISVTAFLGHIVMLVMQIAEINKMKKNGHNAKIF